MTGVIGSFASVNDTISSGRQWIRIAPDLLFGRLFPGSLGDIAARLVMADSGHSQGPSAAAGVHHTWAGAGRGDAIPLCAPDINLEPQSVIVGAMWETAELGAVFCKACAVKLRRSLLSSWHRARASLQFRA